MQQPLEAFKNAKLRPLWHDPAIMPDTLPALSADEKCELLIVGGGFTGHGVGASRFGARIAIELLGYAPSDILKLQFVTQKAMPWLPEPFRWFGVRFTQNALVKADKNGGKRGFWLKTLDRLGFYLLSIIPPPEPKGRRGQIYLWCLFK